MYPNHALCPRGKHRVVLGIGNLQWCYSQFFFSTSSYFAIFGEVRQGELCRVPPGVAHVWLRGELHGSRQSKRHAITRFPWQGGGSWLSSASLMGKYFVTNVFCSWLLSVACRLTRSWRPRPARWPLWETHFPLLPTLLQGPFPKFLLGETHFPIHQSICNLMVFPTLLHTSENAVIAMKKSCRQ